MNTKTRKASVTIFTVELLLSILMTGCGMDLGKKGTAPMEGSTFISVPTEESTSTPAPVEKPTSTPAPTEEPTSTPAPTEEPTSTPAPVEEPTSTPAPTEEPTATPVPTEEPTATPAPTEKPQHIHSWSAATCMSPKTCECGETSGSKLEHDFGSNNKNCSGCGTANPNYIEPHIHSYSSVVTQAGCESDGSITYTCSCGDVYTERIPASGSHSYRYGEINCMFCGAPHTHDWNLVVQTNSGVEITPDEDFCCHSGWYFDTYEELRAHMEIPNVHGMIYLNDGSNGVTSVSRDYEGEVAFYACCQGWANCAGDGEGERIEYEITQEVQFCKLCGVRGEAFDIGERVILLHTYDD